MSELRMYVEHLFQGKVLTAENIELKEEIYGNLVARYEDLVAGGMAPEEALRRTKESFTSVDDVLGNEGVGSMAETTVLPADPAPEGPAPEADAASAVAAGAPAPPEGMASEAPHVDASTVAGGSGKRKVWPWVLGGVAAFFLFVILCILSMNLLLPRGEVSTVANDAPSNVANDAPSNVANGEGIAQPLDPDDTGVTVDPNGPVYLDGEPADELLKEVVESSYNDVVTYADSSLDDVDSIDALIFNLPMGEWAANFDMTRGNGVLHIDYDRVPDYFDGDSIDIALAYNATALFCAVPEANRIQVTLTESDEPYECDCYAFDRTVVEETYGVALDVQMINEAGWKQLKTDNLYRHDFAEHLLDRAEYDGRNAGVRPLDGTGRQNGKNR